MIMKLIKLFKAQCIMIMNAVMLIEAANCIILCPPLISWSQDIRAHQYTHMHTAPPGPPQSLQVIDTSSTDAILVWLHPPESQRYGPILHYFINCSTTVSGYSDRTMQTSSNSTLSAAVTGLHPYTTYSCCVSAVSAQGRGDLRCQTAQTEADGR